MKRLMIGAAALAALVAGPALAADMPAEVPGFSWTGPYVGVFAGAAFESRKHRFSDIDGYNFPPHSFTGKTDKGFTGGLTLGYNVQLDNSPLVFGVEGELGYIDLGGKQRIDPLSPGGDTRYKAEFNEFYATLSGKLGVAFDRVLIYGKAGVAYLDSKAKTTDSCVGLPCGIGLVSASKGGDEWHFTAGAGLEYAITDQLSLKGEYTYINTRQTIRASGVPNFGGPALRFATRMPDIHIAKVGLNYRFNW